MHTYKLRWRWLIALVVLATVALSGCGGGAPEATATVAVPEPTPEATIEAAQPPSSPAEGLTGRYLGTIDAAGQRIEIEVEFSEGDQGVLGTMDIPAQGLWNPAQRDHLQSPEVSFTAFSGPSIAAFAGEIQESGTISGSFTQLGVTGSFTLEPSPLVEEPLPYRQEEVVFEHGDITLAGTLTLPEEGPSRRSC